MKLINPDSLKKNGFVAPKTLKKGDMYFAVKAEDMPENNNGLCRRFFVNDEIIDAIPTIEAEPVKHGRWIENIEEVQGLRWIVNRCSCCNSAKPIRLLNAPLEFNYCPNCGARMDLGEAEE